MHEPPSGFGRIEFINISTKHRYIIDVSSQTDYGTFMLHCFDLIVFYPDISKISPETMTHMYKDAMKGLPPCQ